jgi:hypothetical protein
MTSKENYFFYLMLFGFTLIFISPSCNSDKYEYSNLEEYYKKNVVLHSSISDSLNAFCKANHTDVTLKQSRYNDTSLSFQISFDLESRAYPVYYDSLLIRHDPYPEKTLKYKIPLNVIKSFKESIYWGVSADSTKTFFADEWYVKFQLGTQGDSQYGILISSDTSILANCDKRLSPNVCLTKGCVP